MIDFFVAKDGSSITRVDGKYTASRYYPTNEAEKWYQSMSFNVVNFNSFIFLGIGSGHQIVEFLKHHEDKRVIVIERRKELVDFFKENYSLYSQRVEFVQISQISELLHIEEVISSLNSLCYVVEYTGAMTVEGVFYFEMKKLLIGRDPDFFKMHLNFYTDFKDSFTPFLRVVETKKSLLSIKDLEKIVQSDENNRSVLNRAKLLRELVV